MVIRKGQKGHVLFVNKLSDKFHDLAFLFVLFLTILLSNDAQCGRKRLNEEHVLHIGFY